MFGQMMMMTDAHSHAHTHARTHPHTHARTHARTHAFMHDDKPGGLVKTCENRGRIQKLAD